MRCFDGVCDGSGWVESVPGYCKCPVGEKRDREDKSFDRVCAMIEMLRGGKTLDEIAKAHGLKNKHSIRMTLARHAWDLDAMRIDFLDDPETLRSLQDDVHLIDFACRFKAGTRQDLKPLQGPERQRYQESHKIPARYLDVLMMYAKNYTTERQREMSEYAQAQAKARGILKPRGDS